MLKIASIGTLVFLLVFSSCMKNNKSMEVVRDCTGTYLRINGKDYQVCNFERVSTFSNGAKVRVTYKKIKDCSSASTLLVCSDTHENEGWIAVQKVTAE